MRAIVVGAGGVSNAWFGPLKDQGVQVAALVDLDVERAGRQAEKHGLQAVVANDLARVLREVRADFLVDLTVPAAHCAVTCAGMEAGLHVIGEKPMAASMAEARKMVETSRRTGRMFMVSQSRRWEGSTVGLKRAIGEIGELTALHCDFFIGAHFGGFREAMGSPLILDMAIHHFDLARFFSGLDPVSVYAEEFNPKGSWYAGAAAAHCLFEMQSGVRFTYRGSWCAEGFGTPWNGAWRVIGTKGTVRLTNEGVSGEVVKGESSWETDFIRPVRKVEAGEAKLERYTQSGALAEMLEFFRSGKMPQTECGDNVKSLRMVFGVVESGREGKRVGLGKDTLTVTH